VFISVLYLRMFYDLKTFMSLRTSDISLSLSDVFVRVVSVKSSICKTPYRGVDRTISLYFTIAKIFSLIASIA
jgi:hypothetical protein